MGRKKGLLEQMLDARAKAKARRLREERQAALHAQRSFIAAEKARAREAERSRRQQEAEQVARQKAEQRERTQRLAARRAAEQERIREKKRAERLEQQAANMAAAEAKRLRRHEAKSAAEASLRKRAEFADKAKQMTADIERRVIELYEVHRRPAHLPQLMPWTLESVLNREGPDAFRDRIQATVAPSAQAWAVASSVVVKAYRPEARELIVELQLPGVSVIPGEVGYRVVGGDLRATPRKPSDITKRYERLLAGLSLKALDEVMRAAPATLVTSVVLDGRVKAIDPASGRTVTPLIVHVQVERSEFEGARLDQPELDPVLCLKAHNALVSPHPGDLVAVKPVLYYDIERYRTIENVGLALDLDSRLDLLSLSPNEFEALIRSLFEAIGLKSWQTQTSKDEGVDAVAVNEDPVLGGLAIIQAKRYAKVVGYESVTALAGVMDHKRAAKGILVTTSWVGKASRDFANANGRMQIIEGRELKRLIADFLHMDVLISLPAIPTGWQREEVA